MPSVKKLHLLFCLSFYVHGKSNSSSNFQTPIVSHQDLVSFCLEDAKQSKHILYNNQDLPVSFLNIFTGGLLQILKNTLLRGVNDYTNIFLSEENLKTYAISQREKLEQFLANLNDRINGHLPSSMEEVMNLINDEDIIRDIALDEAAFATHFKHGHYFLETVNKLGDYVIKNTIEAEFGSEYNYSIALKMLNFRWKLHHHIKNNSLYEIANALVAPLQALSSPFNLHNTLNNFNYNNLKHFMKYHRDVSNTLNKLLKSSYASHLQKIKEEGLILPFTLLREQYPKTMFIPFKVADILCFMPKIICAGFKKTQSQYNLLKDKVNSHFHEEPTSLPKPASANTLTYGELQDIKTLRHMILMEKQKIERLQYLGITPLSYGVSFTKEKLDQFVRNKVIDMFEGIFLYFSGTFQSAPIIFVEEIIMPPLESQKLVNAITAINNNIKNNKPLPHVLVYTGFTLEQIIRSWFYDSIKRKINVSHIKNPIALTQFRLQREQMFTAKTKENEIQLKKTANRLFHKNVQSIISLLQVYFFERIHQLPLLQQIVLIASGYITRMVNILINPESTTESLIKGVSIIRCIEISGMHLLCGERNNDGQPTMYSAVSVPFISHVSGNLLKHIFLLAYANGKIDEAVESRFSIVSRLPDKHTRDLSFYVILVRKHLLLCMEKVNNFLLLENNSFEKLVVDLSYKFYSESWSVTEIEAFFHGILSTNILKKYDHHFSKHQLMELTKEVKV